MIKDWGKVFVATRYQPQLPAHTCESLIGLSQFGLRNAPDQLVRYVERLEQAVANANLTFNYKDRPDRYLRQGDVRDYVYSKTMHKAANILVRRALQSGCDSICFIDSDAVFGTDALEELRNDPEGWQYDVLQAFTVKRGWPPEPMFLVEQPVQPGYGPTARKGVFFTSQIPINPDYIYPGPSDDYRIAVSLHFTLIRLDLLRRMIENDDPETTFFFEYARDNGEDINFSIKANALGARLGMTTRLKVAHVSEGIMGWDMMVDYYYRKFQLDNGAPPSSLDCYEQHYKAVLQLSELVAEFTGEDVRAVYHKATMGAGPVADKWKVANPFSVEGVQNFYATTQDYLYDLILWNTSPSFQSLLGALTNTRGETVLDFGGGIGTLAEFLASRGNTVHYHDLPGVVRNFAEWRFAHLPEEIRSRIESVDRWGLDYYDLVIAIDVIEHLHPDRVAFYLDGLIGALRPGGLLFAHNNWSQQNGAYPQHYDHSAEWAAAIARHGLTQTSKFTWQKPGERSAEAEAIHPDLLRGAIQLLQPEGSNP